MRLQSPRDSLTRTQAHFTLSRPPQGGERGEETSNEQCLCQRPERLRTMVKKGTKVRIEDLQDIYEYCAGIDVHKGGVTVCAICEIGRQIDAEVVEYGTTTGELRQLGEWLREKGVTHVVMEATGVYWRPGWEILGGGGL